MQKILGHKVQVMAAVACLLSDDLLRSSRHKFNIQSNVTTRYITYVGTVGSVSQIQPVGLS